MKKILLSTIILLWISSVLSQITVTFPYSSAKLNSQITQQVVEAYYNLKKGDELIINVLSSKELKKLDNEGKIGFSKSRCNKLAEYCMDSLLINPLNLKYSITPLEKKKQATSTTNAAYRNFTNRTGIYKLVISKPEIYECTGKIDTSSIKPIKTSVSNEYIDYLYARYVTIVFPENAFDCECERVEFELREYFDINDMLITGLTTRSDDKALETGGMLYLAAFCNGKKVNLKKSIKIVWRYETSLERYDGFSGTNSDSNINWKYDKDIKTKKLSTTSFEGEMDIETEHDNLILSTTSLGWINADIFLDNENNTNLLVKLNEPSPNTYVRLVFKDNKTILPGYFINNKKSIVEFSKIPQGKETSLLVYEKVNDLKIKWTIIDLTTGDKNIVEGINLKESDLNEFKNTVKVLW